VPPSGLDAMALLAEYEMAPAGLVSMIEWRPEPSIAPDPLGGDVSRYSATQR
jgi:hypothetical protein